MHPPASWIAWTICLLLCAPPLVSQDPEADHIDKIGDMIRDEDHDGVIDSIGTRVKIRGAVTTESFAAFRGDAREYRAYVQDDTGGIRVTAPKQKPLSRLLIGIDAEIIATVDQYNGCPYLLLEKITRYAPTSPVEPRNVDLNSFDGEASCGQLVEVHGEAYHEDGRYFIGDHDGKKLRLFLRPAKNYVEFIAQLATGRTVRAVGVVEQYDTSDEPFDGYRIRPRQFDDLEILPATPMSRVMGVLPWILGGLIMLGLSVYALRSRRANRIHESPQAQRTHALGILAGGIAHEFNNYLLAIIGFTEIAKIDLPDNSSAGEHLDKVLEASERAKVLIEQILSFGRSEESELAPLNARDAIAQATVLLRAVMPSSIFVQTQYRCTDEVIHADRGQLSQLLLNLGTNSSHAMPKGGKFTIALTRVDVTNEQCKGLDLKVPGPHILLEVSDNGIGMDEELVKHIFDPFFTTRGRTEGTGLGLSVVHGIVQRHSGSINVDSAPGKGTRFLIYIPIALQNIEDLQDAKPDSQRPPEPLAETPGQPKPTPTSLSQDRADQRILIVDDQTHIVQLVERICKSLGYQVTSTQSAATAETMVVQNPDAFDLLITDMTMPIMTGLQLANSAHASAPEMRILLMTGNNNAISESEAVNAGIDAMISKPFGLQELAQAIESLLPNRATSS